MKLSAIIFLSLCLHYSNSSFAFSDTIKAERISKLKHAFGQLSFGGGFNGMAIGMGGGFIWRQNDWGFEHLMLINFYRSKNRPDDYKPSSNFLFTNSSCPKDNAYVVALKLAREFHLENKKVKLAVAAGPSFAHYRIKSFKEQETESYLFGSSSNYGTLYSTTNALGIMLKGSAAMMPRSEFGIQLSAVINLNAKHCYAGLQFELIFGKFWTKPKKIKLPSGVEKIRKFRFKEQPEGFKIGD